MLSEEEKENIEQAISYILRGIDIESSALILEKAVMDNYIIASGRVNVVKIATRQILNFIKEYSNKGYLDVVREKVKANEQISKLQKEKKILESVKEMYVKHKHVYQKQWLDEKELNREKDKIINLMQEYFVGLTVWDKEKDEPIILKDKKEVEQFFEKLAKETH